MTQRDWTGLGVVILATLGLLLYRSTYIEPRAWGAACAVAAPPLACAPRAALLWLQREYLWGGIALALGLWSFGWRAPFAARVAAVAIGVAGVINYNATWGMIGAALGLWSWIGRTPKTAQAG